MFKNVWKDFARRIIGQKLVKLSVYDVIGPSKSDQSNCRIDMNSGQSETRMGYGAPFQSNQKRPVHHKVAIRMRMREPSERHSQKWQHKIRIRKVHINAHNKGRKERHLYTHT